MEKIPISIFKNNLPKPTAIMEINDRRLIIQGDLRLSGVGFKKIPSHYENSQVNGHVFLDGNELTNLIGSPKVITGGFYAYKNQLESLEGCPQEVGGDFSIGHNKKEFTEKEVRKLCNVKGKVYV